MLNINPMFLSWLKKLLPFKKIENLERENRELKDKLVERQEHINKTNAYWKRKMNDINNRTKKSVD
jgi:hypothetical protein